jgi:hypothetical protein
VDDRPAKPVDYATLNIVWAGLAAGVLAAARATGADAPPGRELPVLGLASFTVTKALAKEKVGIWVREPVVEQAPGGERRPKGRRLRYAVGELLTCTRCLGTWSSLALVGLRVLRPGEGRVLAAVLATAGLNDWAQTGFTWLGAQTNRAEGAQDSAPPLEALVERARRQATPGGS